MQDTLKFKILVESTDQCVDIVSSVLWDLGAIGVVVEDSIELDDLDCDYIDETLLQNRGIFASIAGFFDDDVSLQLQQELDCLKETCEFEMGSLKVKVETEDAIAWLNQFKTHFESVDYGKVVVLPEWHDNVLYNKPVVKLQLASAFGTGKHETTSMCIEHLQRHVGAGATVADVGCGSGILGLVALKLGAKFVAFSDLDEQAIKTTQYNLDLNGILPHSFRMMQASFLSQDSQKYDIIVANLTANLLIDWLPNVVKNLHDQSLLIVSGIILDRFEHTKQVFEDNNFCILSEDVQGEWASMVLKSTVG